MTAVATKVRGAASRPPKRGRARTRRRPLIIVGADARAQAIYELLARLDAPRELCAWTSALPAEVASLEPLAVVLAIEAGRGQPRVALEALIAALGADTPIFVTMSDETSGRTLRSYYALGAAAVLSWPQEALVLPQLIAEMAGMAWVSGTPDDADEGLTASVRAHLRLGAAPLRRLKVSCQDGVVTLRGRVPNLACRYEAVELAEHTPGVRGVLPQIDVAPPEPVPDAQLERGIRKLLESAGEVDLATLGLSARGGVVTIAGSTSGREALNRIARLVCELAGVRELKLLASAAPRQQRSDSALARRLDRDLRSAWPELGEGAIAVFGGVAVLRGSVSDLPTRRRIERVVSGDDTISRVVNKLRVQSDRGALASR